MSQLAEASGKSHVVAYLPPDNNMGHLPRQEHEQRGVVYISLPTLRTTSGGNEALERLFNVWPNNRRPPSRDHWTSRWCGALAPWHLCARGTYSARKRRPNHKCWAYCPTTTPSLPPGRTSQRSLTARASGRSYGKSGPKWRTVCTCPALVPCATEGFFNFNSLGIV